ncbi:MAG: T9SS type A sorting domain-containing protein [Prevotellaceae bacterium]|nr:T9SS type A sorting domain-containing protein [Prevotellaceae bacterium]
MDTYRFRKQSYAYYQWNAGGIIAPEGNVTLNAGSNKTFVITPDNGYQIRLVMVDEIPNAQAKADGYYTFTNIADNHSIAVLFETSTSGIDDVVAGQLKIFPNPVKDEIFIKSDLQIQKVEIYSLTGVLLLSENNFNEKLSVSALPAGVYLLKVYTDKGMAVSKIVKE